MREPAREQVLAYRLAGHRLHERAPFERLVAVVGAIGLRDAQGSGLLALHARLDGVTPSSLDDAIDAGTLVHVASARGADAIVPADDVGVFTRGTFPRGEESLRARLKPLLPVLDRSGHSAEEAVQLAVGVAEAALAAGPVDIGVLSGALTRELPELSPMCRGRCRVEHIDQGLFDLVGEWGVWRRERTPDGGRLYVQVNAVLPPAEACRAELVRRYLRCYGPSTAGEFAEWCGIGAADANESLVEAGTTELAGRRHVLAEDAEGLLSATMPDGVRVLPPRDPYLLGRDRSTTVPDRGVQKRIWRATPTDGVVVAGGDVVATWRPRKKRDDFTLVVTPVGPLPRSVRAALADESASIAALRGLATGRVETVG